MANAHRTISFPNLADYSVPISILLSQLFPTHTIMPPPPTTRQTIELGSRHSPDSVCVPFKYNLGNFIEALDAGADLLFSAGGGCRFGYYAELQEAILRDLGYKFDMECLFSGPINLRQIHQKCRQYGSKISLLGTASALLLAFRMVKNMDSFDIYIRSRIGFERVRGSFEQTRREFLAELSQTFSHLELSKILRKYRRKFAEIPTEFPEKFLRVGIVGELYTLMEPFANFFVEKTLAKHNVLATRYTNATYLIFQKDRMLSRVLREAADYIKYPLGADGTETIAHSNTLSLAGYDGLLHIKPFGCMPEVNAMPMLERLHHERHIPIVYLSFDSQTSEAGVQTRLEAFCDMLKQKSSKAV